MITPIPSQISCQAERLQQPLTAVTQLGATPDLPPDTLPFSINTCRFDYECFEYWADAEERVSCIRTLSMRDYSRPNCGWQKILLRRGMAVLTDVVVVEVWSDDGDSRPRKRVCTAEEVAWYKDGIVEALGREVEVNFFYGKV